MAMIMVIFEGGSIRHRKITKVTDAGLGNGRTHVHDQVLFQLLNNSVLNQPKISPNTNLIRTTQVHRENTVSDSDMRIKYK